jgi:hypothetical protein
VRNGLALPSLLTGAVDTRIRRSLVRGQVRWDKKAGNPFGGGLRGMTLSPTTGLVVNRSFRASLLLTGSAELAEAAIVTAIDAIEPETSNDALFRSVMIAATNVGSAAARNVR